MANFSDTSYLARICYIPFVLIWMVIRIWSTSRWESFSFLRFVRLEPRSLFNYTFFFALLVHLAHDIILYSIKIKEGYNIEPIVIEKPESNWTTKNLQLNYVSNYLDSISISFTIASLFTLQIFWSYIMEQMSRKQYTGVWEYWINLVLGILLLPVFPILVYLLDALIENPKYKENIPRLSASGIALILCFIGGLRVHFEIDKLLNLNSRLIQQNREKLEHFQDLNIWLSFALFMWSASYLIISIDGILPILIKTRFISDLLIIHVNFGGLMLYICLISVFNPDFSIKQKPRAISGPFDVSKTNSEISMAGMLGPNAQIMVETSQNVKIEQTFINPNYRPYSTTPPMTPISSKMDLVTPLPSPSSAFAGFGNINNQKKSSPLRHQSWQQDQSVSDVSSQQISYNEQATLTENVDGFETTPNDESWQRDEPQNYANNIYNPIMRTPSQNNTLRNNTSTRDSMYARSSSV